ncbi:hypothetical protein [Bifidobacterium phasiani]|uniref:Uncharacterized protein n=1 Tax=Bifidobacterium phasiani TaxID=2834431 RepID=A0ABS6W800_9BIFI|nr:hypothetical protein [Bifidobacterium phasiani]MBW3082630.1 hypothetical protein [Bifidobacterium phasiani]
MTTSITLLLVDAARDAGGTTVRGLCPGAPDASLCVIAAVQGDRAVVTCPALPLREVADRPIGRFAPGATGAPSLSSPLSSGPSSRPSAASASAAASSAGTRARSAVPDAAATITDELWMARAVLDAADAPVTVYDHAGVGADVRRVLDAMPHLTFRETAASRAAGRAAASFAGAGDAADTTLGTEEMFADVFRRVFGGAADADDHRAGPAGGRGAAGQAAGSAADRRPGLDDAQSTYLLVATASALSLAVLAMLWVVAVFGGWLWFLPEPLLAIAEWAVAAQATPLGVAQIALIVAHLLLAPKAAHDTSDGLILIALVDTLTALALLGAPADASDARQWIMAVLMAALAAFTAYGMHDMQDAPWRTPFRHVGGDTTALDAPSGPGGMVAPALAVMVCATGVVPIAVARYLGAAFLGMPLRADGGATLIEAALAVPGLAAWIVGAVVVVGAWLLARIRAPRLLCACTMVVWLVAAAWVSPMGATLAEACEATLAPVIGPVIAPVAEPVTAWFGEVVAWIGDLVVRAAEAIARVTAGF